jgi:hypothetical protein
MSTNRLSQAGAHADSLPAPDGIDRYAVHRALDRERLREEAPDLPRERLARIVKARDELRRGVYETEERLETALGRALLDLERATRLP